MFDYIGIIEIYSKRCKYFITFIVLTWFYSMETITDAHTWGFESDEEDEVQCMYQHFIDYMCVTENKKLFLNGNNKIQRLNHIHLLAISTLQIK